MTEIRTWESMRARIETQLIRQTGRSVFEWGDAIRASAPADLEALRSFLTGEGVTGYPAMLLGWEVFGYPDYLTASASELVDGQYADRRELRPVFDAAVGAAAELADVSVQARKTYVTFVTPRRTFAVVQPTTRRRLDLGLRLPGVEPHGRLLDGKGVGNDAINVRIALESVDDLDEDALSWLRRAHEASL